jgi:hypothetical protein
MLRQLLFGGAVSVANIAIHAFVMTIVVQVVQRASAKSKIGSSIYLVVVMIPTVLVLMATHTAEVMVWAFGYYIANAAPEGADRLYFAFVNYTTLGYGDVVPVARWRLLGPMTAMNGILLFGWSTAVIFEVLRKAIAREGKMTSNN